MTQEIIPAERGKALEADKEIQAAFRAIGTSWVQLAIMLSNFRKREYYRPLGYDGFNAWLEDRVQESRASCYSKMRLVEDLARHIPLRTLQIIPIENCKLLSKVPESKRDGMVEKAKTLPITEFAALVGKVPGNALNGEEAIVPMTFMVELSQKDKINEALLKVMEDGAITRRADALECLAAEYLNG